VTPFFFGSSRAPLFGVHHAPAKGARDTCVVVVPPMGQEALRAHRALKQLCVALARERFHALRFDLFGTGDSAGDFEEASLDRWADDARTAADELRDRTGASRVSLVGLRLGAVHALTASAGRRDVDKLVLWEPVISGGAFLAELERRHVDFLRDELPHRAIASTRDEALGFPITAALRASLLALDLTRAPRSSAKSLAVVAARASEDERRLAEGLPGLGARSSFAVVELEKDWNSEEAVNSSLVPAAAIEAVVRILGER
jgi:pimeloyl-ACP methyl ester carboxylesterase